MKDFFLERIRERRRSRGRISISRLAAASEDGFYLDDLELCANLMVTLGAAQVTTQDMLGNGLLALLRNPDQLQAVIADHPCWRTPWRRLSGTDGPVQLTNRIVMEDTELAGREAAEGPDGVPDPRRGQPRRREVPGSGSLRHPPRHPRARRLRGGHPLLHRRDPGAGGGGHRLHRPSSTGSPGCGSPRTTPFLWRADNLQFRGLGKLKLGSTRRPRGRSYAWNEACYVHPLRGAHGQIQCSSQ